jgi:D-apionate oxidoisomerase
MYTVAIFGAGGSMGTRASQALVNDPAYRVLHVEPGATGRQRLVERGITPVPREEAISEADTVLLAVPDQLLTSIASEVVLALRPRTLVICLDPAAPYHGKLPKRADIAYFVTHPGHPPLFGDEATPEARRDFFGTGLAKQSIVSALMQGEEADYHKGEAISCKLFGPILRSHRLTVEQMAILEPALAETLAATCLTVIREGMDEAVRRGVPAAAARDFLLGHLNIELAIVFGESGWKFSQGCQRAIDEARPVLFQSDWKKIFEPEQLKASVARIAGEA